MRVALNRRTGRIIEAQSGDEGGLKVLFINAKSCGIPIDDVDAKIMPDSEFYNLLAAQKENDKTYGERRQEAYPPIGDQLDALYKAGLFPGRNGKSDCRCEGKIPENIN